MPGVKLPLFSHLVLLLYVTAQLGAQCIVNNPGGSKINPNRPADADVPEARVSPLSALNRNLPAWLCFTAGYRTRLEGSDTYLLTRFRLGMLLKPRSWFQVYTELQDT